VSGLRHIHPGAALLAATAVTAAIALNRGIDLLWGIALLLACALLAALLLPQLQLRGLRVTRRLPAEGIAGQPLELAYIIEGAGRWPRYGLLLRDRLGVDDRPVAACYLPRLAGRETLSLKWAPPVRGLRVCDAVWLECSYPLGLWTARRRLALPAQELLVYPDAQPLRPLPLEGSDTPEAQAAARARRGGHEDLHGLRPWQPGDALRAVDWRRSARGGELLLRQFEQPLERVLWIGLELAAEAQLGEGAASSAERMFLLAHSLALRARQEALAVGLFWCGAQGLETLPPVSDAGGYLRLRDCLARLPLIAGLPQLPAALAATPAALPRGGSWLLFNAGGAGQRAALALACRRQGASPLLLEFDPAQFEPAPFEPAAPPQPPRRLAGPLPVWILGPASPLQELFAC